MSCHPHLTDEQKKGSWSSTRGSNIRREKLELPKPPIVNCHTIGEHARLLGNKHLVRGRARAREALRSIGQENLTSPRIPRTASLGYRRKGAEPWLLRRPAEAEGTAGAGNSLAP